MSQNPDPSQIPGGADTNKLLSPTPSPRVSLPIRGANPNNPNSERLVDDISVDHLLIREADLATETDNLLSNVTQELYNIDQSLIHLGLETSLTETQENTNVETHTEQIEDSDNQQKILNWSEGDETQQPNQNIKWFSNQSAIRSMGDPQQGQGVRGDNNQPSEMENLNTAELNRLIDLKVQEIMSNRDNTSSRRSDSMANDQIGLQDAIRLLPKSFDGKDTENLEIFLEKCEFVVSCVVENAIPRLLQAIQTRLTGKARQITKFKTFDTWEELRETLKTSLEPQRTTQHLFLELYATKQRSGEDILSYSMRIETLQNLIVEQETVDLSPEIAQAMERSIKRQVIQVFMEGLGSLKDFIKARNPPTLEKAIQAAREEERIKTSVEESKKLYKTNPVTTKKTGGSCNICNKPGHWARDCRSAKPSYNNNQKNTNTSSGTPKTVYTVTCQYCRKPGHTKDVCRKLKYVNSKKNDSNQPEKSENSQAPSTSGGRPAASVKTAVVSFQGSC